MQIRIALVIAPTSSCLLARYRRFHNKSESYVAQYKVRGPSQLEKRSLDHRQTVKVDSLIKFPHHWCGHARKGAGHDSPINTALDCEPARNRVCD